LVNIVSNFIPDHGQGVIELLDSRTSVMNVVVNIDAERKPDMTVEQSPILPDSAVRSTRPFRILSAV
jgi:hypothetical protein